MTEKQIRVRFAPSPTGHMHLGSARTALYNYLLAKQTGGKFILRIEDTDQKRYVEGAEQELIDGLRWLGLNYDEGPDIGGNYGPYRQTERKSIYLEQVKILLENGSAFPCFCTAERLAEVRKEQQKNKQQTGYDGTCKHISPAEAKSRIEAGEPHVIRFNMPREGKTLVNDLLRGQIVIENKTLDDSVLIKSDGLPTYHFAAMVDDHFMEITHVFRGSEWLASLPLHSRIIKAFGWQEPVWIHLSIFLKPSGKGKMSKREKEQALADGYSIFVKDFDSLGFIPEGLNNWIALMGWGAGETENLLTLDEMIEKFDIRKLNPSPAAIDYAKLDYFNSQHIRKLDNDVLMTRLLPFFNREGINPDSHKLRKIIPIIRERLVTLDDCIPFAAWFFKDVIEVIKEDLLIKNLTIEETIQIGRDCYEIINSLESFDHEPADLRFKKYFEEKCLKPNQVYGFLRTAISGQAVTPPLFESMDVIGKPLVLERINNAIRTIEN
ncbi:MAG TPA: glutamate--tRNA ligase [Anaerolineales bacterium]|nr:glutamate--tRNA ligase [Anaerolineales bacterium]